MKIFHGKYNFINVMIDEIEDSLKEKINRIVNHPAFKGSYLALMPDCHEGIGAAIGFTQKLGDDSPVIPNVVGVDIGCGMLALNVGNIPIDLEQLDKSIRKSIPLGTSVRSKQHDYFETIDSDNFFQDLLNISIKIGSLDTYHRAVKSMGTLGGGNHFIEIGKAPNKDKWIIIHSGSRNFGKKVADYHQDKAKALAEITYGAFTDAFIAEGETIKHITKDLEYLPSGLGAEEYLTDMRVAQSMARYNRRIMMYEVLYAIDSQNKDSDPAEFDHYFVSIMNSNSIESVHNYIDFRDMILRKGATPARKGEKVIIPFNMRDGIAICTGKGSSKYNYSAPHGAGRIMSRSKAHNELSLKQFKEDMKDVYTTSVCDSTLDESPRAYKDMQFILDNIKETVDVDFLIKPLYNLKASH